MYIYIYIYITRIFIWWWIPITFTSKTNWSKIAHLFSTIRWETVSISLAPYLIGDMDSSKSPLHWRSFKGDKHIIRHIVPYFPLLAKITLSYWKWPFDLPINGMVSFPYVSLPEGKSHIILWFTIIKPFNITMRSSFIVVQSPCPWFSYVLPWFPIIVLGVS